jgi:hypothetical protein
MEPSPIRYEIWSRVERLARGRYVARVSAIPSGVPQRCAPEERAHECGSYVAARAAAIDVAKGLAHDIRARGNQVMHRTCGPPCSYSAPVPANERRSLARAPEEA